MRGTAETPDLILSGEIGVNKTVNTESINIYENGDYTPPAGVDGYDDIHVDVRPVIDSITIRENGTYAAAGDVDGYGPVVVNVPQSAAKVYAKNINANGNYYPDEGYDGFSQVSVNVPGTPLHPLNVTENGEYNPPSGEGYSKVIVDVPTDPEIESITITENGTYTAPTGVDGYSPVIVNVPQPEDAYYIKDMTPGAIASFDDGTDNPMKSLTISIEPVQDLHGYDHPWAGGAGKNKLPVTATSTTKNGVTLRVNDDGTITLNGTSTNSFDFYLNSAVNLSQGTYILNNGMEASWGGVIAITTSAGDKNSYRSVEFTGSVDNAPCWLYINSGVTFNNLVLKPMIRLSTVSDATFAPYSNICLISGWTEEVVTVTDNLQNPTVTHTTTIPFVDGQGQSVKVYGGSVDVINGVVTPCPYYASYNGEQLTGEWISDRDVYSPNTTPTTGAQVVNIGATGTPLGVQPTSIKSIDGENNVSASTGDVLSGSYFSETPA